MAQMKRYTDAHFEVVSDADPQKRRPRYSRADLAMLALAAAFGVYAMFFTAVQHHNASAPPAQVAAPPER